MTRIMKYCDQDSVLCIELFDKIMCWIGLVEVSNVVGVTLVELFTRGQQLRVLSQVYDFASKLGYIIDERNVPRMEYSGGFVYEPIPGLYEYIPCLDFKSLYPSVMIAYNICYTTLVPPELMDKIPDELCHVFRWTEEIELNPHDEDDPEVNEKIKTKSVEYYYKFVKQPIGLLPQILTQLISQRDAVKKQMKTEKDPVILEVLDRRQLALKVSSNSVSGNTPIPCMVNNTFQYLTIEELADESSWINDTDNNQVAKPRNGIKVWSDVGWTDINFVIRHPVKAPLKRILTHTGCVDCTDEHSLLRPNGQEVKPSELSVGDHLMHRDIPLPIDTPLKPKFKFISNEVINNHILETIYERTAFVWGLFFAEGTCGSYDVTSTSRNSWCIYNNDRLLLEKARNILNEIEPECKFEVYNYGEYPTTLPNGKMGISRVLHLKPKACGNYGAIKRLVSKYRNLFYDQRKQKKVPNEILNTYMNIREAFLLGYYAGDGARNITTRVVITNRGQIGTAGLYYLAKSLGYMVSMAYSNTIGEKEIFRLECSTKFRNPSPEAIKRIDTAPIPPPIAETRKYEIRNNIKLIPDINGYYKYKNILIKCARIPKQGILNTLDSTSEKIKNNSMITEYNPSNKKVICKCLMCNNLNTIQLKTIIRNQDSINYKVCSCLNTIILPENNIKPYEAPIINNEYVEYIYDIETVSHHFAAGVGNMIVHNSMYGAMGAQNGGKLPLVEAAACITAKSRESIKKVNSYLESKGKKVVYGDSVTPDTPILIRSNEIIKYYSISELHKSSNKWIYNEDTQKYYLNDVENIEVWSDKGFTKIKYIMKHKTNKRIYRIITDSSIIKVTEDHSLLNEFGNEVSPNAIKIGDRLMVKDLPMISENSINGIYSFVCKILKKSNTITTEYSSNCALVFQLCKSLGYSIICDVINDKKIILKIDKNGNSIDGNIIRKIEDLGYIDDYVYDLETENHHFAAGIGELIVHNTDSSMPHLDIKDPKTAYTECAKWAAELSKLFPPPMEVELDWVAHTMFNICKKKYVYIKMDKEGNPNLDPNDIGVKGVALARRDNCQFQRQLMRRVLWNVLTRKTMRETLDMIIDDCIKLMSGGVDWKDLVMIKGLGSNYKSPSYFMKIFGDELSRIGKPAAPGERLEYVIVKTKDIEGKQLLGYKMRLPSTYIERLGTENSEKIDYIYYIEKILKNCIEQIYAVGFQDEIAKLEAKYLDNDQNKLFKELRYKGYEPAIDQLMITYNSDKSKIIDVLLESNIKNIVKDLKTKYISKRGKFLTRITDEPIKIMLKIIEKKKELTDYIKTLVPITDIPKLCPAKINIVQPGYNITTQQVQQSWLEQNINKYHTVSIFKF